ncbi:MAG: 30S ribosomal protein S16 [Candidatus Magasanikbacteria bacterium RIFOXYD2_FULL_39_9]|uniref:Small ribosomal subunit protein bS16 n=1 Tax=Candidatus Magasanikbacteria bacterium RIFOXYD1_FULL_40_23 TaxID=1798705 RepID=A0A1F6P870_9BACT|nr:MAG: 30S ribosomal protein S16 [Candidatus Magasanikbacteria bacterium RIFOXYD2_FULL_39_9]OGH92356.1 MAG: 30S ribosomal protein S16 [Candidatus Magasanikbacteria bacterium RIFOXYD1_FULL_40_23]
MLTIRLQRMGKKNAPTYRLVIAEKGRDTQGRNLEILGTFNPRAKENGFVPNVDRIKFWLERGAQPSPTLHNLFVGSGLITDKKKAKSVYISDKRAKKIEEKKKSEKPAAAAPAPVAEVAPAPVEEAPAA